MAFSFSPRQSCCLHWPATSETDLQIERHYCAQPVIEGTSLDSNGFEWYVDDDMKVSELELLVVACS